MTKKIITQVKTANAKYHKPHMQPCLDEDMPTIHGVKLNCHMMYLIQENHKNFINSMLEMKIPKELQLKE